MNRFAFALGCGLAATSFGSASGWAETAEANYRLYCVQCHGTAGNGQGVNQTAGGLAVSARDHGNAAEMTKLSDEDIRLAIAKGGDAVKKSELMPPWDEVLTGKEIDDLVAYMRKLCKCVAAK
ncbi:MAG: cytochrome c [Alphaproteobacteria bacterium]|nr:cytochrome c [Alphaproteobacteria bacterium]